jgi:2-polyprenyl-6-hydroxyphenyl methylase/3-demethylubiquinone-9 3-methyltransferase
MRRALTEDLGIDPGGLKVLDVGSGGGLLAEEFARLGCAVTGVDLSRESVAVAREHAREEGLRIEYQVAAGERLPFEDGSFEAAYCCDVLEHVESVPATLAEIARVLGPGAVFLYDTVNRTARSRLLMIKIAQEWKLTRWAEPDPTTGTCSSSRPSWRGGLPRPASRSGTGSGWRRDGRSPPCGRFGHALRARSTTPSSAAA